MERIGSNFVKVVQDPNWTLGMYMLSFAYACANHSKALYPKALLSKLKEEIPTTPLEFIKLIKAIQVKEDESKPSVSIFRTSVNRSLVWWTCRKYKKTDYDPLEVPSNPEPTTIVLSMGEAPYIKIYGGRHNSVVRRLDAALLKNVPDALSVVLGIAQYPEA